MLDADDADEADSVQDFFAQPPVEQVQRLYSIDEVKRSARIRDMVRRLEIGDLTFEPARPRSPRTRCRSSASVANAMLKLLKRNPAETFLIEGHTDAVGSDIANLRAVGRARRDGRRILDGFLRHSAGEPGDAGLWRALPEGADRRARAPQPPRHHPPHHPAGDRRQPELLSRARRRTTKAGSNPGLFCAAIPS